jgi:hypothetical protein
VSEINIIYTLFAASPNPPHEIKERKDERRKDNRET